MRQRKTEWTDNLDMAYHDRQFKNPYRSTIAFCDWLEKVGCIDKNSELNILDVGSGQGANIFYMAQRYPKCRFIGFDINPDIVRKGNKNFRNKKIDRCVLVVGDSYNLSSKYLNFAPKHNFKG